MTEADGSPSRPGRSIGTGVAVGVLSFVVLLLGVASEPHFVDESAYFSQSGFADLLLSDRNAPAWLEYAGYNLPPLPKYLVGASLRFFGHPRPTTRTAWEWYANTSRRFETPDSLFAARLPSVVLGAVGCVAIYVLGRLTLGPCVGITAAVLLLVNPLYRTHARRAMSDVPAEAFLLVALALGAWGLDRIRRGRGPSGFLVAALAGGAVGLSVLCKLNGAISGLILAAWAGLALLGPTRRSDETDATSPSGKGWILAAIPTAGLTAFGLFVLLNPFLTAAPQPPFDPRLAPVAALSFGERVVMVAKHRAEASRSGQALFPNDALIGLRDKVEAVAVQGFGRFGPFGTSPPDSRIRFDPRQDRGAWIWGPIVLAGWTVMAVRGALAVRSGRFPTAWLPLIHGLLAAAVVTIYIPLAWDRYYLSIQPGACLAGATAAVGFVRLVRRRFVR